MIISLLPLSLTEIIAIVVPVIGTVAVAYWTHKRGKQQEEVRWRTEHVYDDALEEFSAILNEDVYPGSVRNRRERSFWSDFSESKQRRLPSQLRQQISRYSRRLGNLETIEQNLAPVNREILSHFPDDLTRVEGTDIQILAGGYTDFEDAESHGENPPELLSIENWCSLTTLLMEVDAELLEATSSNEVRDILLPEDGVEEHRYPNEPTLFESSGLRPEYLSFWEEEFPEWDGFVYTLVEEGVAADFLEYRQQESEIQDEIEDLIRDIRQTMLSEINSLSSE